MYVYKITNKINGMLYIGITTLTVRKRWNEHKCAANTGKNTPLYRAMRKHGIDNFEIVEVYKGSTRQEIEQVEKDLIKEYGTYIRVGKGYNLTLGGEGVGKVVKKIGSEAHNAVLNEDIVAFIRNPEMWNVSNTEMVHLVADRFFKTINKDTLKAARQGKCWKHLDSKHPPIKVQQGTRKPKLTEEQHLKMVAILNQYRNSWLKPKEI